MDLKCLPRLNEMEYTVQVEKPEIISYQIHHLGRQFEFKSSHFVIPIQNRPFKTQQGYSLPLIQISNEMEIIDFQLCPDLQMGFSKKMTDHSCIESKDFSFLIYYERCLSSVGELEAHSVVLERTQMKSSCAAY